MKKLILGLIKKLCFGLVVMYSINILLSDLNVNLPFNVFSISVSTFLGIPGIVSLVLLNIFII